MIYTSVPELPSKPRPIPQPEKVSVRIRKMRDVADSIADKHLRRDHLAAGGFDLSKLRVNVRRMEIRGHAGAVLHVAMDGAHRTCAGVEVDPVDLMCHHASLSGGMINTALDAVNGPV